jgi:hypothetical protein
MRRLANPVIQVLNLLLAVATNFVLPAIIGLEGYGEFLRLAAPVFFVAKMLEQGFDLYAIDQIARGGRPLDVLRRALPLKAMIGGVLIVVLSLAFGIRDVWMVLFLGLAMYSSSLGISALYGLRSPVGAVTFLLLANLVTYGVLVVVKILAPSARGLLLAYALLNLANLSIALFLLGSRRTHVSPAIVHSAVGRNEEPRMYWKYMTISVPGNIIQSGLVAIATLVFAPSAVGGFRVGVSLVQAATSVFPLNARRIFYTLAACRSLRSRIRLLDSYGRITTGMFLPVALLPIAYAIVQVYFPGLHARLGPEMGRVEFWWFVAFAVPHFMFIVVAERAILAVAGLDTAFRLSVAFTVPILLICAGVLLGLVASPFAAYGCSVAVYLLCTSLLMRSVRKALLRSIATTLGVQAAVGVLVALGGFLPLIVAGLLGTLFVSSGIVVVLRGRIGGLVSVVTERTS